LTLRRRRLVGRHVCVAFAFDLASFEAASGALAALDRARSETRVRLARDGLFRPRGRSANGRIAAARRLCEAYVTLLLFVEPGTCPRRGD
jgi:hypothetical protein